ncbi:MAG: SufD family Fe-S cluster assembly protein [Bacilli bacterium]
MTENEVTKTLTYVDEIPASLSLKVPAKTSLKLCLAAFRPLQNTRIDIEVGEGGTFEGAFADFSSSQYTFTLNVYLEGSHSSCDWHLAAIADKNDSKRYDTSVFHKKEESLGLMSNYGIAEGESKLVFAGISEIEKGAKKTHTRQVAKIIVFDPKADGQASPILKIGENDVEASHAAVVGRLSEEHLFYLESRGIDEAMAKRLITLGYLKPIELQFDSEALRQKIDDAIEGGVSHD